MRREEVAIEAGISVTWYTWLEQGRPVRVSRRTLDGLGRALRLDATERVHLIRLARAVAGADKPNEITTAATPSLHAMADGLEPHAVYVVNGLWDVLYANESARTMFGDFGEVPGVTDNVLRRLYLDARWRTLFPDWLAVSGAAVAQFRAATGHMVGTPRWREFIRALARESADFAKRWERHELASAFPRHKTVRGAMGGERSFLYASVAPDGEPPDVRLIVYTAVADVTGGAKPRPRAAGRRAR